MTKPAKLPLWATDGVRVDPGDSKADAGWQPGEKLPAQVQNWLQGMSGDWLEYLEDTTDTLNTNVTSLLNAAELRRHHDRSSGFVLTNRATINDASELTATSIQGPRYLIGNFAGRNYGAAYVNNDSGYIPVGKIYGATWRRMGTVAVSTTHSPTAVVFGSTLFHVLRSDGKLYSDSAAPYDQVPTDVGTLTVAECMIHSAGRLIVGGNIGAGNAAIAYSSDYGDTWTTGTFGTGVAKSLYALSSGRLVASIDSSTEALIYTSDDNGANWTLRNTLTTSDPGQYFFGECPITAGNVYAVSRFGYVRYSSDNGTTWASGGDMLYNGGVMRVNRVWGAQPTANGLCILADNWDRRPGLIRMSHPYQAPAELSYNWTHIEASGDQMPSSSSAFRAANALQPYSPASVLATEKDIYGFRACINGTISLELETPAV